MKTLETIPGTIPTEILQGQPDLTKEYNVSKSSKEEMISDLLKSNKNWTLYNYRHLLVKNQRDAQHPFEYQIGEYSKEYKNYSAKYLLTLSGAIVLDYLTSPVQIGIKTLGPHILNQLLKDWT